MGIKRALGVALVVLAVVGAGAFALTRDSDPPEQSTGRFGGDADRDGIRDGSLTPEQAAAVPDEDALIVSIGDSVASGEGNPDVRLGLRAPRWLLPRCHRSLLSAHAETALAIERADPDQDVAFVPLGCSGARIETGLLRRYRGIVPDRTGLSEPAQLEVVNRLARRREIDALLVSIGANDVYFSSLVKLCIAEKQCWRRHFDPERPFAEASPQMPLLERAVADALAELPARYAAVERRLSRRVPRDRVVIVEYFDPTVAVAGAAGSSDDDFCDMEVGGGRRIDRREARWAHEKVLGPLNAAVRRAADEHGWRLVEGVDEAFAGHGICARPARERWVDALAESVARQGLDFSGTLHPNEWGHGATAALIRPVLEEVLTQPSARTEP
jgi:hypothetical protein